MIEGNTIDSSNASDDVMVVSVHTKTISDSLEPLMKKLQTPTHSISSSNSEIDLSSNSENLGILQEADMHDDYLTNAQISCRLNIDSKRIFAVQTLDTNLHRESTSKVKSQCMWREVAVDITHYNEDAHIGWPGEPVDANTKTSAPSGNSTIASKFKTGRQQLSAWCTKTLPKRLSRSESS
ncbi:hypothetical protein SARC_12620 [Sphaeroforma arctica JP610]|uniref:Uncharacterized protein n=1 Tax=Sphaeroforma arctica JP610 TaxID=667725 RepID=A0A0L0FDK2_9EUKA|nr:hypothetical protein SARC_12620 [Sphaeroforma arctica JP610]KNC74842.1 hypothetical protein SARC_12620 [Sphaeroforma arctica JP610]|eukprot:XP_014148744.1 hypothetical protein SARC_12620 [Sphaeroforma arctica JP610]